MSLGRLARRVAHLFARGRFERELDEAALICLVRS